MARKTPSRLELRKQAEAAEASKKTVAGEEAGAKKAVKKKKTAATRTSRSREKVPQRRKLVWGVFSASMKEEARFPYDQREAAEQKLEQLRAKAGKLFFIQPIKEAIVECPEPAAKSSKK